LEAAIARPYDNIEYFIFKFHSFGLFFSLFEMPSEDFIEAFHRCKLTFGEYNLKSQNVWDSARLDLQMVPPSPRSSWANETPPLSPGKYRFTVRI
jgi:hypothetical protein